MKIHRVKPIDGSAYRRSRRKELPFMISPKRLNITSSCVSRALNNRNYVNENISAADPENSCGDELQAKHSMKMGKTVAKAFFTDLNTKEATMDRIWKTISIKPKLIIRASTKKCFK